MEILGPPELLTASDGRFLLPPKPSAEETAMAEEKLKRLESIPDFDVWWHKGVCDYTTGRKSPAAKLFRRHCQLTDITNRQHDSLPDTIE
ncbi:MAG: hypothetical protein ACYCPS_03390 [Candidatus Saccharimonadales bacterium]